MWRAGLHAVATVPGIQRQAKAFALLQGRGCCIALVGHARARFGIRIRKQQVIGDVLIACRALLWQIIHPSQQLQQRADQFLLSSGFVGLGVVGECIVCMRQFVPEAGKSG